MEKPEFTQREIARLKRDALKYIIPHFAQNPIDPKICERGEPQRFKIVGRKYSYSGSTYGGNTIACAATLANIQVIEEEGLVERAARYGKYLEKRFRKLMRQYPIIGDVRGIGMLWALELEVDPDPADWERVIGAKLTGAYLCCRAVAPHMRKEKRGCIINIASISVQTGGVSGGVHYTASKGGMLALTKGLARDLAPFGVTVNAISPGQIDADPNLLTPEQRQHVVNLIPLGRLGEPEEIAYAALFLASSMARYITGATIDVNGGILKRWSSMEIQ